MTLRRALPLALIVVAVGTAHAQTWEPESVFVNGGLRSVIWTREAAIRSKVDSIYYSADTSNAYSLVGDARFYVMQEPEPLPWWRASWIPLALIASLASVLLVALHRHGRIPEPEWPEDAGGEDPIS